LIAAASGPIALDPTFARACGGLALTYSRETIDARTATPPRSLDVRAAAYPWPFCAGRSAANKTPRASQRALRRCVGVERSSCGMSPWAPRSHTAVPVSALYVDVCGDRSLKHDGCCIGNALTAEVLS
jgi:hypothetical protein